MEMTWRGIEIPSDRAPAFIRWLKREGLRFEPSSCYDRIYVTILAADEMVSAINGALDVLVWGTSPAQSPAGQGNR